MFPECGGELFMCVAEAELADQACHGGSIAPFPFSQRTVHRWRPRYPRHDVLRSLQDNDYLQGLISKVHGFLPIALSAVPAAGMSRSFLLTVASGRSRFPPNKRLPVSGLWTLA